MPTPSLIEDDLTIGEDIHVRWVLAPEDAPAMVISDNVLIAHAVKVSDSLTIGDATDVSSAALVRDSLAIADALHTSPQTARVADRLVITDESIQLFPIKVADTLTIGDATSFAVAAGVMDVLHISDEAKAPPAAVKVSDSMSIADVASVSSLVKLSDGLTIGDAVSLRKVATLLIQDSLTETDQLSSSNATIDLVLDHLMIADEAKIAAVIAAVKVQDNLVIEDFVKGAGPGGAWTAHAELMAMSRYTNYPFNSLAVVNGYLMAAGPAGIYDLRGDTDAGVHIDTALRHDISDDAIDSDGQMQNDPHFKRPRYLYVSYQSDGVLRLNLGYVDVNGTEQTASFDLPTQTANQFITGRIKLGRSIRSRYLRPTLVNLSGAAWGMNEMKLIADSIRRKV
jgi:hypothetical protein